MRQETFAWLQQARRDLFVAERNFEAELYEVVLVYCQQAVEKGLKALHIEQKHELAPRTHSIQRLIELLDLQEQTSSTLHGLEDYYIRLRYPEDDAKIAPYVGVGREESEYGLRLAQEAFVVIESELAEDAAESKPSQPDK